jgi:hypothetical protein
MIAPNPIGMKGALIETCRSRLSYTELVRSNFARSCGWTNLFIPAVASINGQEDGL